MSIIDKIVKVANGLTSPNQAINYLLNGISKKDPNMAKVLKEMINNKEDASVALIKFSSNGTINLQQLSQIKKYYNLARKMGMKQQIPNSEWIKAENAIRQGLSKNNTKKANGFNGF